jgi:hypothetical protein
MEHILVILPKLIIFLVDIHDSGGWFGLAIFDPGDKYFPCFGALCQSFASSFGRSKGL